MNSIMNSNINKILIQILTKSKIKAAIILQMKKIIYFYRQRLNSSNKC